MTPYSAAAEGSFFEPGELTVDGLSHVLRQLELGKPFAQLVHLGLLGVAFAQLVLDRLQLLAQEVFALALLHLGLTCD